MKSASCDTGLMIKRFYFPQLGRIKVPQASFPKGVSLQSHFHFQCWLSKSHVEILCVWYLQHSLEAVLPLLLWYTFIWVWKLPAFFLYQTCQMTGLKAQFVWAALRHKARTWVKPHPSYTAWVLCACSAPSPTGGCSSKIIQGCSHFVEIINKPPYSGELKTSKQFSL